MAALDELAFAELPVTAADGDRAGDLEPHHRDPFDRVLVAQAARLDAAVVTRDRIFEGDGTETVPA